MKPRYCFRLARRWRTSPMGGPCGTCVASEKQREVDNRVPAQLALPCTFTTLWRFASRERAREREKYYNCILVDSISFYFTVCIITLYFIHLSRLQLLLYFIIILYIAFIILCIMIIYFEQQNICKYIINNYNIHILQNLKILWPIEC